MALTTDPENTPIVWLDIETTGLDPASCSILEIAAIATDNDLAPLALLHLYIYNGPLHCLCWDDWALRTHAENGLEGELERRRHEKPRVIMSTSRLPAHLPNLASAPGRPPIRCTILAEGSIGMRAIAVKIDEWIEENDLEGSSVGGANVPFDRSFLAHAGLHLGMLSYRSLDISVLRRALRRWRPDLQLPEAPSSHRAFDDLAHAIEIARIHRDVLRQGLVRRS